MKTQDFTNQAKKFGKQINDNKVTLLSLVGVAVAAYGAYSIGRWILSEMEEGTAEAGTIVDETQDRMDIVDEASRESFPASDAPSW